MMESDNIEIKVAFHSIPRASGQFLCSVTPKELLNEKAKKIISRSPYVVDPTTSWISHLKENDYRRSMRFGITHNNGSVKVRLPGETEFFPVFYVTDETENVWIDVFFCDQVKSVGLRAPLFPRCPPVIVDVDEEDLMNEPSIIDNVIKKQGAQIHLL